MFYISKIIFILLFTLSSVEAKKTIVLYTYHLKAPFVLDLDNKEGLSYDFASYLNSKIEGYNFSIKFMPRKRLEENLKGKTILWVNPIWFKDKKKTKFLWSHNIVEDKDLVVSHRSNRVEFEKVEDLFSKKAIIPRGFFYWNLDKFLRNGQIKKVEVNSENSGFKMILRKRADFAIISQSTLNYLLLMNPDNKVDIHVASAPLDSFSRSILIPKEESKVHKKINEVIKNMKNDKQWKKILKRYQ